MATAVVLIAAAVLHRSSGLSATYFSDPDGTTAAYVLRDWHIETDALTGEAPVSPDRPFSVRWFGFLNITRAGSYRFDAAAEGTATVLVDETPRNGVRRFTAADHALQLDAGPHAIAIAYSHTQGRYGLTLRMSEDDGPWRLPRTADLSAVRRSPLAYTLTAWSEYALSAVLLGWSIAALVWLARRVSARTAVVVAVASVPVLIAVAFNTPEWLRGPAPYPREWQWPYHQAVALWRLGPAIAGAAGILAAIALINVRAVHDPRVSAAGLGLAIVSGFVLQLGVLHLRQGGAAATIAAATEDENYTSFFSVAATADHVQPLLAGYAERLDGLPLHARTHPPGPVIYYRAVVDVIRVAPVLATSIVGAADRLHVPIKRFEVSADGNREPVLQASALLSGWGVAVAALLAAWPVAVIVRRWGGSPAAAARAGCLWTLCPAALFFVPNFDAVVALLVASACALGCVGVTYHTSRRGLVAMFGAGLAAGTAFFCSFGAAPMLAAAALIVVALSVKTRVPATRSMVLACAAFAGTVTLLALPMAAGFDWFDTIGRSLRLHREHFTLPRSRALWLRFNLLDFAIFAGWPLLVWGAALVANPAAGRRRDLIVLAVVVATVLVVDLADVTRGEVGRLWMPFMPLAFAGVGLGASSRARDADWLLVAVLLAASAIVLGLHWSP